MSTATNTKEADRIEMVHVGLPFLRGPEHGFVVASAEDGRVSLRVYGDVASHLYIPPFETRQIAQMLLNAANEAEKR